MSRTLSESAVVAAFAEHVCRRLTHKTITTLQKMEASLLAGNDSGLQNVWDEICAQVQYEASYYWDTYDDTTRVLIEKEVEVLLPHEREALWLQTSEADDWNCKDSSLRDPYPVAGDDIVEFLLQELYSRAGYWSNSRIRKYLDPD
jgi:hypothetical protein